MIWLIGLALAAEPTLTVPAGAWVATPNEDPVEVLAPSYLVDGERWAVAIACAEALPEVEAQAARVVQLEEDLARQERLLRRARLQRRGLVVVLGGVAVGVVVAAALQ